MKVAFVGTRGIPARYGGFETCAEEVSVRLAERGHDIVVYSRVAPAEEIYRGVHVVHVPCLRLRAAETLTHAALSVRRAIADGVEAVVLFNPANAPVVPWLNRAGIPVATHVDGLEWKRSKWGRVGRSYLRWAAKTAARRSQDLIFDSRAIERLYMNWLSARGRYIAYGMPRRAPDDSRLRELVGDVRRYHLAVARLEPENNVHVTVDAHSSSDSAVPLVVVGDVNYRRDYQRKLVANAGRDVRFLGWVWDQELLDALYAGAASYIHGHSVGGTNPSLLRAIGAGVPVLAFDCEFNREVLGADGLFFTDVAELSQLIRAVEQAPLSFRSRAYSLRAELSGRYDWGRVAEGYEEMLLHMTATTGA